MMLSFSVSLWYFNRGDIFTAMPLAYPGMVWLLAALHLDREDDRAPRGSTVWPVWLLIGATVFLGGLPDRPQRARLERDRRRPLRRDRRAADRDGVDPYGNFPIEDGRPACGPADSSGEIRDHIQTNGRCEAADAQGDTYGPVVLRGLPARRSSCSAGAGSGTRSRRRTRRRSSGTCSASSALWLVGLAVRRAATRGDARVRLGRLAVLPVRVELEHERHDPAGAAASSASTSSARRGYAARSATLGALVKFSPLVVLPLWSGYPDSRDSRSRLRFVVGALIAAAAAFVILLFDSEPAPRRRGRSSTTRSATSSAARRPSRSGTGGSTTRRGCPTCTGSSTSSSSRCSSARSPSTAGRAAARRSRSPRSPARCSSASRWC